MRILISCVVFWGLMVALPGFAVGSRVNKGLESQESGVAVRVHGRVDLYPLRLDGHTQRRAVVVCAALVDGSHGVETGVVLGVVGLAQVLGQQPSPDENHFFLGHTGPIVTGEWIEFDGQACKRGVLVALLDEDRTLRELWVMGDRNGPRKLQVPVGVLAGLRVGGGGKTGVLSLLGWLSHDGQGLRLAGSFRIQQDLSLGPSQGEVLLTLQNGKWARDATRNQSSIDFGFHDLHLVREGMQCSLVGVHSARDSSSSALFSLDWGGEAKFMALSKIRAGVPGGGPNQGAGHIAAAHDRGRDDSGVDRLVMLRSESPVYPGWILEEGRPGQPKKASFAAWGPESGLHPKQVHIPHNDSKSGRKEGGHSSLVFSGQSKQAGAAAGYLVKFNGMAGSVSVVRLHEGRLVAQESVALQPGIQFLTHMSVSVSEPAGRVGRAGPGNSLLAPNRYEGWLPKPTTGLLTAISLGEGGAPSAVRTLHWTGLFRGQSERVIR